MKTILSIITVIIITQCSCTVEFSARSRNYSIELLYFTQLEAEDHHVVISPFGVWSLMTALAVGATGDSFEQLRKTFLLPNNRTALIEGYHQLTQAVIDPTTKGVTLANGNFVFIDDDCTIFPQFKTSIHDDFGASIEMLDFQESEAAAREANELIRNSGIHVSNVIKPDDFSNSRMIVTNVIVFKGLWTYPFDKFDTIRQWFYNEHRKVTGEVNMMYQIAPIPYSTIDDLDAHVIELPYGNNDKYSMLFILPKSNVTITNMFKNFAKISLKGVLRILKKDVDKYGLEDVIVQIPRFQISTNLVLNKPLNNMGVYDIFQPGLASFEKVTREDIFVSAIVHKADIEVTEAGTAASAESSAVFAHKIMSTRQFLANRPFVYFLLEKTTTTVIFGGVYSKPTVY